MNYISDPNPETVLPGETERQPALLIDAHVHLHDCFPPASFLAHDERNFERAAAQGEGEHDPGSQEARGSGKSIPQAQRAAAGQAIGGVTISEPIDERRDPTHGNRNQDP